MAWNPSPEVAVARDAAEKMSKLKNITVDRVVVMFTTADGRIGYASYGATRALCAEAKRMADAMYEAATRQIESMYP